LCLAEQIFIKGQIVETGLFFIFAGKGVQVIGVDKHHRVGVQYLTLSIDMVVQRPLLHDKYLVKIVGVWGGLSRGIG